MIDPTDPRRRHVLAIMGALGAGALAGFKFDDSPPRTKPAPGTTPLATIALPPNSIDVHAHFFNASDASVRGYLTHSVAHTTPWLEFFLERMELVLKHLIRTAPLAKDELAQLQALYARKLAPAALAMEFDRLESQRRESVARAIDDEMRRSGVHRQFRDSLKSMDGAQHVPQNWQEIQAILDPASQDLNKSGALSGLTVDGVFRFLHCMLRERWMTLRAYKAEHGARGISAVFGALVDFDYFYTDLARSPLRDQMLLQSWLAKNWEGGGFMLPLMAYNPWADYVDKGARLGLLREAVNHHGFIGAKIYPPVGFLPVGNTRKSTRAIPTKLNERLHAFFDASYDLGIPVMSHSNSSAGRDSRADENGRPEVWRALIADMAARHEVPLLNLGHFGGDGGEKIHGYVNDWPQHFAGLMNGEGGTGVYGDLGYWSGLRECRGGSRRDCNLARERLAAALRASPKLPERLMYGSDYFMMIKEVDWQRWPEDIASAIGGIEGLELDSVFHKNAMECFGLMPNRPNHERLVHFFGNQLPAWMA